MIKTHLRLAVDIGGTFVDAMELDTSTGEFKFQKTSTTPNNPSEGVIEAIEKLHTKLENVELFVHGTTLGLNAVLERRGAKVGILTNEGFRDIFLVGRANVPDSHMYDFKYERPEPLVRRRCIAGVSGRLNYKGEEIEKLDEAGVVDSVKILIDQHSIEAVAVCFLFSFIDPTHEQRAADLIKEHYPQLRVSISSDITREHKEYERTSTTVLDAYIRPIFEYYIDQLQESLSTKGFGGRFLVMRSGGGAMTASAAKRSPTNTVISGPAGGIVGASFLGQVLGRRDLISFDVGGTSLDVCLVEDGRAAAAFEASLENHPLLISIYDIRTIGAGGGSIAWVNEGLLNVGPKSAGAVPGPICYGRGGTDPTVTDACLILGYINPNDFLGGAMQLDLTAARLGVEHSLATPMGVSLEQASAGVLDVLLAKTVGAVRQITVERGRDPQESALLAFGGAGPLFGPMVGQEIGLKEVIIPNAPSGFSAWGMLSADIVDDFSLTNIALLAEVSSVELENIFSQIENNALESLNNQGISHDRARLLRQLELRYLGQEHALSLDVGQEIKISEIIELFGKQHEAHYGHRMDAKVQILNVRIRAIGRTSRPPLPKLKGRADRGKISKVGSRLAYCFTSRDIRDFEVFKREDLYPDDKIVGPSLVNEGTSVTVVHSGQQLVVDDYGHLIVTMEK